MNFMECQTCRGIVQINNTGICMGCQRGFIGTPQEDHYQHEELLDMSNSTSSDHNGEANDMVKNVKDDVKVIGKSVKDAIKRKEEIEKELSDADEKPSPKKVPARKQASNGSKVGKGNPKRKVAKKSKKEG